MSEHHPRRRPAPEITRGSFPILSTFLRGYLHEDWQLDYESAAVARDTFLEDATAEERREFAEECSAFHVRTAALTLEQVQEVLGASLGSAWHPASIDEVRSILKA